MKNFTKTYLLAAIAALLVYGTSCQKSSVSADEETTTTLTPTAATSIMVAATTGSLAGGGAAKDSLALVGACPQGGKKDSVAFSALPASIATYLTANYAGYTSPKAFKITDKGGTLKGYVVVITFNSKPVGLEFDTTGAFVKVLEQREPADMKGPGWHKGGRFENRGGLRGDTIALNALPAAIKTYMTTNYGTDTLLHAVITRSDTSYIVISANKGLFATVFSSKLVFVKRIQINARSPKHTPVAASALPVAVTTYLTTTYPGYVFDKAFSQKDSAGAINKYVVLIDASGTRYAVEFDGTGKFVKSTTVR